MNENKLIAQLNKNLSDVQVLYVKLHNYHWNIQGPQFFEIHRVTEEYYNFFALQYDDIAERILQLGGKPFNTMKDYLENSEIKEEEKNNFTTEDVVNGLIKDFEYLANQLRHTSDLAGIEKDNTTVNMADDFVQWLEKAIWMLKSNY